MNASMRPRWTKVLHDLWDNKSRTILAVLSIAVGVFSIGVITGAYVIISSDINTSYAANNPMNIEIRNSPINSDAISMVMNTRGFAEELVKGGLQVLDTLVNLLAAL